MCVAGPLTFNATTHRSGFYDVGMTSLHAFDSAALAQIAAALGKAPDAGRFRERAARPNPLALGGARS